MKNKQEGRSATAEDKDVGMIHRLKYKTAAADRAAQDNRDWEQLSQPIKDMYIRQVMAEQE